jgi:hypothetical protein
VVEPKGRCEKQKISPQKPSHPSGFIPPELVGISAGGERVVSFFILDLPQPTKDGEISAVKTCQSIISVEVSEESPVSVQIILDS